MRPLLPHEDRFERAKQYWENMEPQIGVRSYMEDMRVAVMRAYNDGYYEGQQDLYDTATKITEAKNGKDNHRKTD